jgi:hypothetical protein
LREKYVTPEEGTRDLQKKFCVLSYAKSCEGRDALVREHRCFFDAPNVSFLAISVLLTSTFTLNIAHGIRPRVGPRHDPKLSDRGLQLRVWNMLLAEN